jgi:hypothetical protein
MYSPIIDRICFSQKLTRISNLKTTQLPITYATTFFSVIVAHSLALNVLQREQMNRIKDRMTGLSRGLTKVTSPRRISGKKSDIDIWREILRLFVDDVLVAKPGDATVSEGGLENVDRLMTLQNDVVRRRLVCKNRNVLSKRLANIGLL